MTAEEATACWTFGLLLVAGAQVYLFLRQLRYIRKSLGDNKALATTAKIQADAALASIALAREEFNASRRPEIVVHAVSLVDKPGEGGDLDKHSFAASFLCFNKGTTPAKGVEVRGRIMVTAIQDILTDVQRDIVETVPCVKSGGKFMFEMTEINERRRTLANGVKVYCVGTIRYLDGNNSARETGFCFELCQIAEVDEAWVPVGVPRLEYAY